MGYYVSIKDNYGITRKKVRPFHIYLYYYYDYSIPYWYTVITLTHITRSSRVFPHFWFFFQKPHFTLIYTDLKKRDFYNFFHRAFSVFKFLL